MKKALMVASVASMIKQFNLQNIKLLQEMGYKVTVATNFEVSNHEPKDSSIKFIKKLESIGVDVVQISMDRSPFRVKNYKAYLKLKKTIDNGKFDLIHCQSPVGGVLTRLAAINSKAKVIYTAHGFHFYEGASWINWAIFYPIEKVLSKCTDDLIVINNEDFEAAKRLNSKRIHYVPGIGIDIQNIKSKKGNRPKLVKNLNISDENTILISVGELNNNKNQKSIIKALEYLKDQSIVYLICGVGEKDNELKALANTLGVENKVKFLGYRFDIIELLKSSDIFVFPSYREGLSVSLMEAKATGLPCIVSDIRGNNDLIMEGKEGFRLNPDDSRGFSKRILELHLNPDKRKEMSFNNLQTVNKYSIENINDNMRNIYNLSDK